MTIALGLACTDGALLATDSMGMRDRIATTLDKIQAFTHFPAAWTFAGSTFVAQELEHRLPAIEDTWQALPGFDWNTLTAVEVKDLVQQHLCPLIKGCYDQIVTPPGAKPVDQGIDLMVAAWTETAGGFLIRVHADLAVVLQTEPMATMGYGHDYATVARGLMNHHLDDDMSLHAGRLVGHRTIAAVCEVSSGGVGLPVQLATVDATGTTILTQRDVDNVGALVDRWKTLERETLVRYASGDDPSPPEPRQDLPTPD